MDEMEAKTVALREKVDGLLESLGRQVSQTADLQARAAVVTGQASSPDGQVSVTTDAQGVVTGVRFAPSAFVRNTPDHLSPVLVHTIQAAAADAKRKTEEVLLPLKAGLPDLPDLFEDAPSLRELTTPPAPSPMAAPPPPPPPAQPPRARRRPVAEEVEDEPIGDIMRRR
ncbi:YbaB/EbfC family nucleoid-associated protein [Amycolatopsis albispora]|uniref:Uncharacterized protein n=1 Tax=Amycolatopsis albispora TaxID=1804986 RepID=A0A344L7N8_9PSEU|nr:YbaB/EbfC family nucleoid-associated protein [Amycolatopsis albispora]AXB44062.1 hypothetical protein A4R43_17285 [Amycolatopsis albispora]